MANDPFPSFPNVRIMTLPSFHNVLLRHLRTEPPILEDPYIPRSPVLNDDVSDEGNDDVSDANQYAMDSAIAGPAQMTTPMITTATIQPSSYPTTTTIPAGPLTTATSSNPLSSIITAAQNALGITPAQTGKAILGPNVTNTTPSWLIPAAIAGIALLVLSSKK